MKKNTDKISIILPNYNSEEFLDTTIKSITNQSLKNWELIIIDDCSNYRTKQILKKYLKHKKIKVSFLKKNRGAGFCRNLAIKKSKGNYVAFIDSDDLWKKNKLINQLSFMKKNNFSFTYTNYETFDQKNKKIIVPKKFKYEEFTKNTSIATSTMMIKRSEIGNIKFTNTEICEDYFFKCKLLKKVKTAYRLDEFLTKYRIRKNSLQSNNMKNFYWIWKINKTFNKMSFFQNLISIFSISINSLIRYGGKNFFY